ncbi:MAG: twin-arginine translocation signal domain-containing protein [Candidatus Hydrogenedens sp.]|nr:twin-arginine translocation signal domain-containing protein [Candidatus Hydrogenedens sp.]
MGQRTITGGLNRRGFLKRTAGVAAAAAGFPYIVPGSALGLDGAVAPSNRLTLGFIGMGKMAQGHLGSFLGDEDVQVVSICDVERGRRESQAKMAEERYAKRHGEPGYKGVDTCGDFRELCARQDIDAVVIATPNHWHALAAVEAARSGKDIYLEKPLARTIGEGQAIVMEVRQYGRVLQVGSQQRSDTAFRFACELVRNGRIGNVQRVHVNVGPPPQEGYNLPAEQQPEGLDWDLWLGPAPWRAYNSTVCPPASFDGWAQWRDYRDYAGGGMTDFGAHHYDIAQWGLGRDGSAPVEVIPPEGDATTGLRYVYDDGIEMIHGGGGGQAAVEWIGADGWVRVNRGQYLETNPGWLQYETFGANETHLYRSDNHKRDWLDCIKTRRDPICPVEIGHSTAIVCHIGNIAYWLRRPLKWNPEAQQFVDDPEANRLLMRSFREPWRLV